MITMLHKDVWSCNYYGYLWIRCNNKIVPWMKHSWDHICPHDKRFQVELIFYVKHEMKNVLDNGFCLMHTPRKMCYYIT